MGHSRMLTVKATVKQNVGHIGKYVILTVIHGCTILDSFWKAVAHRIYSSRAHFLVGDFNTSFTNVPIQLRRCGIQCT